MDIDRTGTPIPRVKCEVDTCKYWESGNLCQAQSIEITGREARNVHSTDCSTFENRS